jgi:hypothetical protein
MLIGAVVTCETVWLMAPRVCVCVCVFMLRYKMFMKLCHHIEVHSPQTFTSPCFMNWSAFMLIAPSSSRSKVTTASKGTRSIVILWFGFNFAVWQCTIPWLPGLVQTVFFPYRPRTCIYNWCNSFFQRTNWEQKYWCSLRSIRFQGYHSNKECTPFYQQH